MALNAGIAFASLAALCCMLAAPALGQCTPGSYTCSEGCDEVLFCLGDGTQVVIDACAEGWSCNATAHECVEGDVCVTPPNTDLFDCHDFGYFPNPYDCTKYHLCLDNNSTTNDTHTCPANTAYDALSTRCSLPLDSRPCRDGPVPPCTKPGQVGPQPENPNIYYVCVKKDDVIAPSLYKCASDEIFVGTKCQQGRRALWVQNL